MAKERVHRFVSKDLTIRIAAVDATDAVKHMQSLQNTMPLPTIAVGRSMVGALLMASHLKDDQMVGLLFRANGPLGKIYAEASYNGHVRGYAEKPQFFPAEAQDALNLGKAMGIGLLSVARHQPFQKQPFQGTVEIVNGEIGQDIAHYLHQSHQIRSLVSLGVYLDHDGKVQVAGGVLIEVMPGAEEDIVELINKNYDEKKPNISQMLLSGATAADLVKPFMEGIGFDELEHEHYVEYFCPCTKERVMRALEVLSPEDVEDIIEKNEKLHITCQVCGKPYEVEVSEVQALKAQQGNDSLH